MFAFIIIMQTPNCTYLIHLRIWLQRPKCHLVGTRWKRPKRSWQVIQSMRQSAVYIDVEARWTTLQAAGVEHHMVNSTIRQGGVVEAGGAESAVSLLEAKSHYKRTERVKHSEESRQMLCSDCLETLYVVIVRTPSCVRIITHPCLIWPAQWDPCTWCCLWGWWCWRESWGLCCGAWRMRGRKPHLALCSSSFPGEGLVDSLESLVGRRLTHKSIV